MQARLIRLSAALVWGLCLVFAASGVFAQGSSVLPVLMTFQPGNAATDELAGVPATLNTDVLLRSMPGDESEFVAPNGMRYVLVTDTVTTSKIGTTHWVAHLRDASSSYRAVISYADGIAFGNLTTPDGNYRLQTQDAQLRLHDVRSSPRKPIRGNQEPLIPPTLLAAPNAKTLGAVPDAQTMAAAPSGMHTIDLMVLYTHGLASKLGLGVVQTRIEHLVAVTNQAYADSLINIQLRLVHSAQVTYTDQITHAEALRELTDGVAPLAGVAALRSAYGADLVTLLNQLDSSVDGACGIAWLLGKAGTSMNAKFAYSVVSVGDDIAGGGVFCDDYTLAHELGHNMGSVHDRANALSGPGAFAYSYGHGIEGRFGDIMSYISPGVGKFSNPVVTCGTFNDPCGVSESDPVNGANNALSLNNTAPLVAAFATFTGLDTTPSQFSFTTLVGVSGGASLVSDWVTMSGLSTASAISVSGGEYSINGGAFTSASGFVSSGQSVQVRVVASAVPFAAATAMLTVGTVSRAFTVVTSPAVLTSTPAVAAGFAHSVALRTDGTVWAWGDNAKGAVGDGSSTNRAAPVLVAGLASATAISAAGDVSLALKADGSVWGWGSNQYGQIDGATRTTQVTFQQAVPVAGLTNIKKIAASYFAALAIDGTGAVWRWGDFRSTPGQVSGISGATAIAAGQSHSMALLSDGSVRVWGGNAFGQLGLGNTNTSAAAVPLTGLTNVSAIAAGAGHSLALRADGTVWAWGSNLYGQLGDGTTVQRTSPVPVLAIGGSVQLSSVVAIAAGQDHSMAIKSDGTLVVWGRNTYGQLGDSTLDNRTTPVALALGRAVAIAGFTAHTLTVIDDGRVWAWGLNNRGNLGDGSTSWRKAPVMVGGTSANSAWFIGGGDMQPNLLSLGSISAPVGAVVASGPKTVGGISQTTPISIFGGEYSVDAGAFTALPGTVNAGQTVSVRVTAPAAPGASTTARLTIGGVSASFTVTAANTGGAVTIPAQLAKGWNLLGNSLSQAMPVDTTFSDKTLITTVWKWDTSAPGWQFYTPSMTATELQTYTAGKGYAILSVINPGEGYWVNATAPATLTPPSATPFNLTSANLLKGWNLVATGNDVTPAAFNASLNATPPAHGLTTLWAWDNLQSKWYFYAPNLEAQGATALTDYITGKGYLDFTAGSKTLGAGTGFWVNKP